MIVVAALLSLQAVEAPLPDCAVAMTTVEINACRSLDLQRETARMERYLAAARQKALDGDAASVEYEATQQAAFLTTSQSAWTAYADIVCDGVYDQWKGGTIRIAMVLGCKIEMTRERTRVIWRDYLTYADTTPPVLPEPLPLESGFAERVTP